MTSGVGLVNSFSEDYLAILIYSDVGDKGNHFQAREVINEQITLTSSAMPDRTPNR